MTMRLPLPTLMLVTDRTLAGGADALVRAVDATIEGGVNAVQLREKDLPPAELLALACRLRDVTAGRALLIVNGPLELALACGADGVHLPEDAPALVAPALVAQGPSPESRTLVGRSVHSLEAARRGLSEGTDYLVAGPVYETRSHPGSPASGPLLIESVVGGVGVSVLAIGGITAGRVDEVIHAGASGVAVISAILGAPSPGEAARELRRAIEEAWEHNLTPVSEQP